MRTFVVAIHRSTGGRITSGMIVAGFSYEAASAVSQSLQRV
jgi:hypothetical protein